MTTVIDSPTNELPPPVAPTPTPPAPPMPDEPPAARRHSGCHIAAIVVGCLTLLPALGMVLGGTVLTVANAVGTDDGYFDVTLDRLDSNGVAIASIDLWDEATQDEDLPWVLDWLDLDVRLTVDGAGRSDDVFVGVAHTDDVQAYLADAGYTELLDYDRHEPQYLEHDGGLTVAAPTEQDFWVASTTGTGVQTLDWQAKAGHWSVVVMNADGSPDVRADVEVGVHSDAVVPIAVTLLVFGGLGVITAVTLIIVGARGRRPR
jgi:hypothetical protein